MDAVEDNTSRDWLDSVARSQADVDAGCIVPAEPLLDRLRASIARMNARGLAGTDESI